MHLKLRLIFLLIGSRSYKQIKLTDSNIVDATISATPSTDASTRDVRCQSIIFRANPSCSPLSLTCSTHWQIPTRSQILLNQVFSKFKHYFFMFLIRVSANPANRMRNVSFACKYQICIVLIGQIPTRLLLESRVLGLV